MEQEGKLAWKTRDVCCFEGKRNWNLAETNASLSLFFFFFSLFLKFLSLRGTNCLILEILSGDFSRVLVMQENQICDSFI